MNFDTTCLLITIDLLGEHWFAMVFDITKAMAVAYASIQGDI
jgi:hypothetical protein